MTDVCQRPALDLSPGRLRTTAGNGFARNRWWLILAIALSGQTLAEAGVDTTWAEREARRKAFQERARSALEKLDTETQYGTQAQSAAELQAEFEAWRTHYQQELARYRGQIAAVWGTAEISSATTWVSYSKDLTTKTVVDYGRREIRVSTLAADTGEKQHALEALLAEAGSGQLSTTRRVSDPLLDASLGYNAPVLPGVIDPVTVNKTAANAIADVFSELRESQQPLPGSAKGLLTASTTTAILAGEPMLESARFYAPKIRRWANQYRLDPSVLHSIIHLITRYNPRAQTPLHELGLMLVDPALLLRYDPTLAKRYEHGDFFDPDKNLAAGAAILHGLFYRDFAGITNTQARNYCVLAGYRAGVANVLKALGISRSGQDRFKAVNALAPAGVYDRLKNHLVHEENKIYFARVVDQQTRYATHEL